MKRIILYFALFLLSSSASFGQNTIKFLGIPIDGTKKEMIDSLKAKGFYYSSYMDRFKGEFNGEEVFISVQTVNNKVWRLAILDVSSRGVTGIKTRFNNLLSQFENNNKYILQSGERLSDEEDISYEITVHDKQYEVCLQMSDENINGLVWYTIGKADGGYRIAMFYENLDNAANGEDL